MNSSRTRLLAATAAWTGILAFVFIGLVGEWTAVDWVGAGAAAVLAGILTIPMTLERMFRLKVRLRWGVALASALKEVLVDFGIITAFLARSLVSGKRRGGRFVARAFPAGPKEPEATTWRGFVILAATLSPNSYVVDIHVGRKERLSHDLVPRRASERPA